MACLILVTLFVAVHMCVGHYERSRNSIRSTMHHSLLGLALQSLLVVAYCGRGLPHACYAADDVDGML